MKRGPYLRIGWTLLLVVVLLSLTIVPANASSHQASVSAKAQDGPIMMNTTVYLSTDTLQPLFQQHIDQQVPGAVNGAITNVVSTLPAADRGWAHDMASSILQPSAQLQKLSVQGNGVVTALRVNLYPGDPKPIDTKMLVTFQVKDASTVQVSAQPMNGGAQLVNGPLTTMQIPMGQLNSITPMSGCGDALLAANLQVPVALGQSPPPPPAGTSLHAYAEIPASSLSAMGSSFGTLTLNNTLSAQNIQITKPQGNEIVATADIKANILGLNITVATATTYIQPGASGGNLAFHVDKTTLTILRFINFPFDTYNSQIEQQLNDKLSGALTGRFNVTGAAIGSDSHIPCSAGDSLLLTGTVNV